MNLKKSVGVTIEHHPNWYRDIPIMRTLILGNYPPQESKRHYHFYYPNRQNRFWKILADIAGVTLNDYERYAPELVNERYAIMSKMQIGVQNIGASIERIGKSSLDSNIRILTYQDVLAVIKKHVELRRILLPGFAAESSTLKSFEKYLSQNRIVVPNYGKPAPEKIFHIEVENQKIECVILNSTSTATTIPYSEILRQFQRWVV